MNWELKPTAASSNMLFLDLPVELIDKILLHAVFARGVKRALRLRLVCKRLSHNIQLAIFKSQLINDFQEKTILPNWLIRNNCGTNTFWHSYIIYRVTSGTNPRRRYLDIRQVAERVCEETTANLGTTIKSLCLIVLQQVTSFDSDFEPKDEPMDPELDLLCAAAYLNLIPIAKRLLEEGHSPTSQRFLFSSPMLLAAWAGNADMLELFQEHLPELEGVDLDRWWNRKWRGKVGPASIIGAARRGDIGMVRLAVYPPSRATPNSTDFTGQPLGAVDRHSNTGNGLNRAQKATGNVEVYKYLDSFFAKPADKTIALPRQARLGNLEMVRYLLDSGANIRGIGRSDGNPLVEACRGCHEDVVDLLLERGADPNFHVVSTRAHGDYPITIAARVGSLSIVRKLVDHGAKLNRNDTGTNALCWALDRENTAMVKLLLALGVDLKCCTGETFKSILLSQDLDSMVKILEQEGANFS